MRHSKSSAAARRLLGALSPHFEHAWPWPLVVQIVDATDFDSTLISGEIEAATASLGAAPTTLLALTKANLTPRLDEADLLYLQYRAQQRGPLLRCLSAHPVAANSLDGVTELASAVLAAARGSEVVVCGASRVGKASLARALAQHGCEVRDTAPLDLPWRTPILPPLDGDTPALLLPQPPLLIEPGQGVA
ncbi:hypothetical protein EMIHUDRAFT_244264 [Emiliania huxleyi CCMP1516]|uniref:G domain-containing protein n=2 Tax=Emiliania huxleyi TaxID=2903 RepID=A0A0D3J126_EMIH1|nr:hypothetical protein EMIHUDRAFT_244264 [Emiliania huxleyi CCMP1516]EOD17211.1 hypothetical protein EMIHUDRAFT_244264 [Emiliania huxleyi CCMP1516]|eukprot:XP_005769640.1 hypothetical protein EMIHUDRAFT_244264 [Emiliania huxleyi CCMP1516]